MHWEIVFFIGTDRVSDNIGVGLNKFYCIQTVLTEYTLKTRILSLSSIRICKSNYFLSGEQSMFFTCFNLYKSFKNPSILPEKTYRFYQRDDFGPLHVFEQCYHGRHAFMLVEIIHLQFHIVIFHHHSGILKKKSFFTSAILSQMVFVMTICSGLL